MAKGTKSKPTNFPDFPLAVTGQTKPGARPVSGGGSRHTAKIAGVKLKGGS
jgi:hypothetical protein